MQDATQAVRCLTVLGHLTGADPLIQFWPVTLRIARLVSGFRRGTLSPEAMFQFESDLQDLLRQAGRLIVQWSVNHLEPDDDLRQEMPPLSLWEGEYYRRRKKSPLRNLNCLFGPIALRRFHYQPLEACGWYLFPLEIQLGIVTGVATPALVDSEPADVQEHASEMDQAGLGLCYRATPRLLWKADLLGGCRRTRPLAASATDKTRMVGTTTSGRTYDAEFSSKRLIGRGSI